MADVRAAENFIARLSAIAHLIAEEEKANHLRAPTAPAPTQISDIQFHSLQSVHGATEERISDARSVANGRALSWAPTCRTNASQCKQKRRRGARPEAE